MASRRCPYLHSVEYGIGGLSHGGSALLDLPYIGNDVGQRIITVAVI